MGQDIAGPWDWLSDNGGKYHAPDSMIGTGPHDTVALNGDISVSRQTLTEQAQWPLEGQGSSAGGRSPRRQAARRVLQEKERAPRGWGSGSSYGRSLVDPREDCFSGRGQGRTPL
eukprot:3365168-Pyramimonas_sp.AAC.1